MSPNRRIKINVFNYHNSSFQIVVILLVENSHAKASQTGMYKSPLLFPYTSLRINDACETQKLSRLHKKTKF